MKRIFWTALSSALLSVLHLGLAAAPTGGGGVDEAINRALEPAANAVSSVVFFSVPVGSARVPLVVVWLIVAAVVFTLYFNFINFRGFRHGFRLLRGDYDDPSDAGEVTHFQALATALSGTVGLGNIAGVAVAVSIGGPGATFWMIAAGLLGMATKFVECTLGVMYRTEYPDGRISGGPMHYLNKGLAAHSMAGLGKVLAVTYAVMCIGGSFGGGNMFQSNQAYNQVLNVTGGEASFFADKAWLFGLIAAVAVGAVIIGGIKSIARVTEKLVPFMGVLYVGSALVILLLNFNQIPTAFAAIWNGAFSPEGITGGFIGVLIQGFQRAAFSNEAGLGTAAIAHSAVKTKHPVTEGIVALNEPFVDTVVVCTMTALVIVITGTYTQEGLDGVQLTSAAFGQSISWFPYVLAVAVVLFAYSTMISYAYYGIKAWTYLFGEGAGRENFYKLIFCVFVVFGAVMQLGAVIAFSDAMIFIMALPNVVGLYLMAPTVKRALATYWAQLERGEIKSNREVETARVGVGD